jgi:hypothetical protein
VMAFSNSADLATMFAVDEVFGTCLIEGVCFVGIVKEDGQAGKWDALRRNLQQASPCHPSQVIRSSFENRGVMCSSR